MLELRQIGKSFDGARAVEPLDLSVGAGEVVALIGPSGCGKSTLLRMIVGLVWPDTGWIRIASPAETRSAGKVSKAGNSANGSAEEAAGDVEGDAAARTRANAQTGTRAGTPTLIDADDRARSVDLLGLRRRMGYVIQSGGLFPHLSARANVELLARHVGWSAPRRAERMAELAELVHLDPGLLERYPLQLSGGQRQRVSLMRALMLDPDLLLLDEPLGALDPMIRAELQRDLREIFDRLGKTVVLVTHDLLEAGYFARRIVLMAEGRIVQQGSYSDLRERPASDLVRRFLAAQRSETDVLDSASPGLGSRP